MALRFVYILVTQEFQNLQLSVGYRTDVQQVRIVVDESGVAVSGTECRVVQHVQEESDVGLYAFDTHLRQRTNRLVDGVVKTTSVRTYFYQQAVVVRGDYRSGKTISAVQTNSESRCGTVLRDGTGIRCKVVGRILSGDTALDDALYLSQICEKVYLIHRRDEFRGNAGTVQKVKDAENIEILTNARVQEIQGEQRVEALVLEDGRRLEVTGVFAAVGVEPVTGLLQGVAELDEYGYVAAGEQGITSAQGLFVAGDVRTKAHRQVITAAADGANAATEAERYIRR